MTRICLPLVRYTLKIPVPELDIPRLKNLVWAVNLGESGSNRIAKGSSNDSSISCRVKELSRLKGGLFQSNSIEVQLYIVRPCNVVTMYLHMGARLSTEKMSPIGHIGPIGLRKTETGSHLFVFFTAPRF